MAKHETIADIIEEKRRQADGYERMVYVKTRCDPEFRPIHINEMIAALREEADRLEAAYKREAVTGSNQFGNAAKLREALAELVENIEMRSSTFGLNVIVDTKTYLDAKAALSAPPRNCDRPECATTKAAQDVWRKEDGGKTAYYDWLLATATEKEGGES